MSDTISKPGPTPGPISALGDKKPPKGPLPTISVPPRAPAPPAAGSGTPAPTAPRPTAPAASQPNPTPPAPRPAPAPPVAARQPLPTAKAPEAKPAETKATDPKPAEPKPAAAAPEAGGANWLSNIRNLSLGASGTPPAGKEKEKEESVPVIAPPVPESLEATGLKDTFIESLILKILYFRGEITGRQLAGAIALKFSLIEPILDNLKRLQLIAVKKSLGMGSVSGTFHLAEAGRVLARDHLLQNQYAGPAPVPIEQYTAQVYKQRLRDSWLTKENLMEALKGLVLTKDIISQLGPAVNAGKSFLIYGQPGNGKTFLAEALFKISREPIYIPFAIEAQGQIIQVYDPLYHKPLHAHKTEEDSVLMAVNDELAYDPRWFHAARPFIMTGGELNLAMLDLSFNQGSKIYDAPFQVKANNGIYLIDDFGRQKVSPAEVLNRWIVPMERKHDYLSFETGGKVAIPFECFLIFSTNLNPDQLGDEAFLRRIQYKMMMKSPAEEEFKEIFRRFCASQQLPFEEELLEEFLELRYRRTGKKMRRCHPRDLLSHAIDFIRFERLPFELTAEVLDHAFESCFVTIDHKQD